MKPDHEAATKYATEWITDIDSRARVKVALGVKVGPLAASIIDEGDTISRAYLDAMARLDKATELLRRARRFGVFTGSIGDRICAFLDERK